MKHEQDTEWIVGRWLADDGDILPPHALQAALARIDVTRQRTPVHAPWRNRAMFTNPRLALVGAAVVAAVAVAVASGAIRRAPSQPGLGARSLVPSATAAGTVAPSSTPDATADGMPTGTVLFHRTDEKTGEHTSFTVSPTGQGLHQLVAGDVCCAIWSPSGDQAIVTVTSPDGRVGSAFVAPNGTAFTPVPAPGPWAKNVAAGAWGGPAPYIAYEIWDDANPSVHGIYRSNGGGVVRVTHGGPGPELPVAFSPDGAHLLFVRVVAPDATPPTGDLYEIGVDGTGLRKLNPTGTSVTAEFDDPASWSPDGSSIAFAAFAGDGEGVYVAPANGGSPKLIEDGGATTSARFSTDGRWIVFDRTAGSSRHALYLVAPDGTGLHEVATAGMGVCCAEWSPDGNALLFQSGPAGAVRLYTVLIDGSHLTELTPETGAYGGYRWGPASG